MELAVCSHGASDGIAVCFCKIVAAAANINRAAAVLSVTTPHSIFTPPAWHWRRAQSALITTLGLSQIAIYSSSWVCIAPPPPPPVYPLWVLTPYPSLNYLTESRCWGVMWRAAAMTTIITQWCKLTRSFCLPRPAGEILCVCVCVCVIYLQYSHDIVLAVVTRIGCNCECGAQARNKY